MTTKTTPWDTEKPVRSKGGPLYDYEENHPAYAVITAHRQSSSPGRSLFGSDFLHQASVAVSIRRATLQRGLSSDHAFARGLPIAEVVLSEAQWATLVSSLNMGDGVPCTLTFADNQHVPNIEPITNRREQFNSEVADRLNSAVEQLQALADKAPTKKMKAEVEDVIMGLRRNLPFVAEQFDRHAEKTIERAKSEVAAMVAGALQRAGLSALAGDTAPLALDEGDPGD